MNNIKHLFICHWYDDYRTSLIEFLAPEHRHINVVGECQDYQECVRWIENHHADYLLIGFPISEVRFLLLLDELAKKTPTTKIVVMTVFDDDFILSQRRCLRSL